MEIAHYVRVETNDYSIHPDAIGRRITVRVDVAEVTASLEGRTVARHTRCWARHQTITDPAHAEAGKSLRGAFLHAKAAAAAGPRGVQVEQRALETYDRMFTVIDGGAGRQE